MPKSSANARVRASNRRISPVPTAKQPEPGEHRWTFLTNHSHVLILLHRDPTLVLREVAGRIGITERAVQRIVADLEAEGFLKRRRVGRRNTYTVNIDRSLRHPIEANHTVGELLLPIRDLGGMR
jgi:predicted transcriptional regulator